MLSSLHNFNLRAGTTSSLPPAVEAVPAGAAPVRAAADVAAAQVEMAAATVALHRTPPVLAMAA